jgi:hypothetical protein
VNTRSIVQLFPRNRYRAAATTVRYYPRERLKMAKLLGSAAKVTLHARVYDRAAGGVIDFEMSHGSMGDELPAEGARLFVVTLTGAAPALPWNAANMPNLPDDGTAVGAPTMGLVDIALLVSGGANVWVECEVWATVEFVP